MDLVESRAHRPRQRSTTKATESAPKWKTGTTTKTSIQALTLIRVTYIVKLLSLYLIRVLIDDERDRKIHVQIKPQVNGTSAMSASVDELRATVENMTLSSVGQMMVSKISTRTIFVLKFVV